MATRFISIVFSVILLLQFSSCQNYICSWERLAPHAKLTRPPGEGPFPAMVLLHGCGGLANAYPHNWNQRLADWGYVSIQVDSFKPRGISSVCAGGMITLELLKYRAQDARLAKAYLSKLSFVRPDKIGVMGWSHGGTTVIDTVLKDMQDQKNKAFSAAVAFYPWCFKPLDPGFPLLILTGALDRWTPADFCTRHAPVVSKINRVKIKVYPDAHHCFDWIGINTTQQGHILRYHPQAAADAYAKVKSFLDQYLVERIGRSPDEDPNPG